MSRRPRLSPDQASDAVARVRRGESMREVARRYGVTGPTVAKLVRAAAASPAPEGPPPSTYKGTRATVAERAKAILPEIEEAEAMAEGIAAESGAQDLDPTVLPPELLDDPVGLGAVLLQRQWALVRQMRQEGNLMGAGRAAVTLAHLANQRQRAIREHRVERGGFYADARVRYEAAQSIQEQLHLIKRGQAEEGGLHCPRCSHEIRVNWTRDPELYPPLILPPKDDGEES